MIRKSGWLTVLQFPDIKNKLMNISVEEEEDDGTDAGEEPVGENSTVNNNNNRPLASANILELNHQDRKLTDVLNSIIENDLDAELQLCMVMFQGIVLEVAREENGQMTSFCGLACV